MDNSLNYQQVWQKPQYIANKVTLFNKIDSYFGRAPKRILDIGCGFAKTSELFQKKYNCEVYLLESDIDNSPGSRIGKWGSAKTFQWYLPIDRLKQAWNEQGIRYTFVDGADLQVAPDVKFDLVYSWLSCGFHYPADTYRDFIKAHTTQDSVVIMDFRNNINTGPQIALSQANYEIIKVLDSNNKKRTCHIQFK